MVSSITGYIHFAQSEKAGVVVVRAALDAMNKVHLNQEAALTCADAACAERADAAVDKALEALRTVADANGKELQLASSPNSPAAIHAKWQGALRQSSQQRAAAARQALDELGKLTVLVGDRSKLILDPDLDSYYLANLTVEKVPDAQNRLADLKASLAAEARPSSPEADHRNELRALVTNFDAPTIVRAVDNSIAGDVQYYGASDTLGRLKSLSSAWQKAAAQLDASAGAESEGAINSASAARTAMFDLASASTAELDKLLDTRISAYEAERARALGLSFAALLVASIVAWRVALSITQPLGGLVSYLSPGATMLGTCVEKISEVTRAAEPDPVMSSIIVEELAAQADDMRKAVLALAAQVSGAEAARRSELASRES